jgi:hypothetical protein
MRRNQKSENAPQIKFDRFNLQKAVGSYRDSADDLMGYDWSRPWTDQRVQQSFEGGEENVG